MIIGLDQIIIREIEKRDNEALAVMIKAVFIEHDAPRKGTVYSDPTTNNLYQLFTESNAVLWVATHKDKVLGCCGIYPTPGLPEGCAELVKFYLPASARGKGIGKSLMEKSLESAKQMGYRQVYIESLPEFSKAVKMYEKQGFHLIDQRLGASGHDSCNIWMLKEI